MASKKSARRSKAAPAHPRLKRHRGRKSASPATPATEAAPKPNPRAKFPVVGIGASAGGLEALETFFTSMPNDSGLAFVVVSHVQAGRPSILSALLSRRTKMPVIEVDSPMRVEPDHVYLGAPGLNLTLVEGVLRPVAQEQASVHLSVDHFFRSLAHDRRQYAIGIVLSGTGNDGTLGIKEIKAKLGLVIAQDELSAQYQGMPHSAAATGRVDFVLPVAEMPRQLLAYASALATRADCAERELNQKKLGEIFKLIRERTRHDFSQYKRSTMLRRIERRMHLQRMDDLGAYIRLLEESPTELELLFKELLIGVTSFFRDPDAWIALKELVMRLLADKKDDYVVRVWVAGCSTGEEAYSLAILLRECMDTLRRNLSVQIFATDLDASAIHTARLGAYPASIATDLTDHRLARFFTLEGDVCRVKKDIRDMLVFAPQDLIADPPFTKIDIVSCRNLMIYLNAELQRRLLPVFHHALRSGGLLFLGSSEGVGSSQDLFRPLDKQFKIYRKNDNAVSGYAGEMSVYPGAAGPARPVVRPKVTVPPPAMSGVSNIERVLLKELVPPTVLVNARGDLLHVHGRTGLFLEPAQGSPAHANLFNMARPGLQIPLASALRAASADDHEVVQPDVQIKTGKQLVTLCLRVRRLHEPEDMKGLFRISFDRATSQGNVAAPSEHAEKHFDRLAALEQELLHARESQQATVEDLETTNEELKSANEELQSTNEELQSTNEELETSKEEMQALNEELNTVNAELQNKVESLSQANNDMKNLLNATNIATVFLDGDLKIKRYTEQAKKVLPLIVSDVGRPIGDLASSLHYDRLVSDAREVLDTLTPKEIELQGEGDAWFLMRILPYRTTENVIDGIVLTFVNVTNIKRLQGEQARLLEILRSAPVAIFGQDRDLRFTWSCNALFGTPPDALTGLSDGDLLGEEGAESLIQLKQRVLQSGKAERAHLTLSVEGQRRTYDFYVEPQRDLNASVTGLSCLAIDVTPAV